MINPIILCGGSGTRLWPLSRSQYPKQFLQIDGELSLFQKTILRFQTELFNKPTCLTNNDHCFIVVNQLKSINVQANIILEPALKNTAAAITAATLFIDSTLGENQKVIVVPADHQINNVEDFHQSIIYSQNAVNLNNITTFGIKPHYPETGYGYIECSESIDDYSLKIKQFVEKPNKELAEEYLSKGNFYWNSGMFYFNVKTMLKELQSHCPKILSTVKNSFDNITKNSEFIELGPQFKNAPEESIDYAVMEKTSNATLVSLKSDWNDIGSFSSLPDLFEKDDNNNTIKGNVVCQNSKNNFIYSDQRLVTTLGIDNLIVVDTPDALLVTNNKSSQDVSALVKSLKITNPDVVTFHQQVHRPWGWYETLLEGSSFKVKRIHVYPRTQLSLQKHRYRSEHWVVTKGEATVYCDNNIYTLKTNQSSFIPLGSVHRLKNDTDEDLQVIEVQNGTYLGEDDIIRLEDDYNRE